MHEIGSFTLSCIPATVVASCRHAFMTDHLLHRRQVGAGVEQPGVKGAMPVAAARSRRITATRSSASRRSPPRLPRTARPNNTPVPCPRTPARRRRLPLYQKVRDRSILIALSARTIMANLASSAYDPHRKLRWTGIELQPIGRVSIGANGLPGRVLKLLPVSCLAMAIAHHEDTPLHCDVRLASFIAANHWRRNIGVATKRRLVIVAGVALKQHLAVQLSDTYPR